MIILDHLSKVGCHLLVSFLVLVCFLMRIIACRYFLYLNNESSKGTETKSLLLAQCSEQTLAWSSGGRGFLTTYVNNKVQRYDFFHHKAHQPSQFLHFFFKENLFYFFFLLFNFCILWFNFFFICWASGTFTTLYCDFEEVKYPGMYPHLSAV